MNVNEALKILGLEQQAQVNEQMVKEAYKTESLTHHPDRNKSKDGEKMKQINAARAFLMTLTFPIIANHDEVTKEDFRRLKVEDISDLADIALNFFEQREKPSKNGDEPTRFWTKKDDSPEWLCDLVQDAHKYGARIWDSFLPCDYRHEFIIDALEAISNNSDNPENDLEPYIYNHDRLKWLSSNLLRASYVDEAKETFGLDCGTFESIGWGQLQEMNEVLNSVRSSLEDLHLLCEYSDELESDYLELTNEHYLAVVA